MFSSVLIANRGEIACRIIRTARAMGMRTVAVYSQADRYALHVEMADEAVAIGGAPARESYLRGDAILRAARATGTECVHPGYGFLAENASFAEACAMEGVTFVGPPVTAIRTMGLKNEAKALMRKADVPVLPGFEGDLTDTDSLAGAIHDIGFPLMVKAVAGGGGTGMRRVNALDALQEALEEARRESEAAFGDARVMIEKCIDRPRHIEVQILADGQGNCVHLFERDCSLQRRHQKIIEEAPAPDMPEGLREAMTEAAVAAARAVDYTGAGTIEFLVEGNALTVFSSFYFLEMNTRLQVEHPVTEEVTGRDLVEWQFRIAAGEPLGFAQQNVALDGHAVEARIYGEDPGHGFLPSSGRLHLVRWPEGTGVRIETGVRTGDTVSPFYDPMLAKIIARGDNRTEALEKLSAALGAVAIAGPRTNLDFLHELVRRDEVASGRIDTGLVERECMPDENRSPDTAAVMAGVAALLSARRAQADSRRMRFSSEAHSPWNSDDGFALTPPRSVALDLLVDGEPVRALVKGSGPEMTVALPGFSDGDQQGAGDAPPGIVLADQRAYVLRGLRQTEVRLAGEGGDEETGGDENGVVRAPIHGRIVKINVSPGDEVAAGEALAVLEAMKMEHRLTAPRDGPVTEISVREGQQVDQGALVMIVGEREGDVV